MKSSTFYQCLYFSLLIPINYASQNETFSLRMFINEVMKWHHSQFFNLHFHQAQSHQGWELILSYSAIYLLFIGEYLTYNRFKIMPMLSMHGNITALIPSQIKILFCIWIHHAEFQSEHVCSLEMPSESFSPWVQMLTVYSRRIWLSQKNRFMNVVQAIYMFLPK